ncbi:MAG: twin-arginine translocation signal domain-containing protein [Chloroflexota bacterium]
MSSPESQTPSPRGPRKRTYDAISRRAFLGGAGSAALVAFLSACRLLPELSQPPAARLPPTLTPLPTFGPPGTLGPDPTGAPSPSAPGPSPSPSGPTPFPPGPPSKLGLFVAWHHPQIFNLVRTRNVAVVKTLELDPNFLAEIKRQSPGTLIVGRLPWEQPDLGAGASTSQVQRLVEKLLPLALDPRRAGLVDAWEGFNEPVAANIEQVKKLAELEVERVRLLAERGLRSVVGNFAAGQPPLEYWPYLRPALEAALAHRGYLGLHEYSAPVMQFGTGKQQLDRTADEKDEGWLTLRYRKVYRSYLIPMGLRLPLVITECGIDGGIRGRPGPPGRGWRDFVEYWESQGMGSDGPGTYVGQLAWYDAELHKDDYVIGAAIFAMTAFQEWVSYQLLGDAAEVLKRYLLVHPAR